MCESGSSFSWLPSASASLHVFVASHVSWCSVMLQLPTSSVHFVHVCGQNTFQSSFFLPMFSGRFLCLQSGSFFTQNSAFEPSGKVIFCLLTAAS